VSHVHLVPPLGAATPSFLQARLHRPDGRPGRHLLEDAPHHRHLVRHDLVADHLALVVADVGEAEPGPLAGAEHLPVAGLRALAHLGLPDALLLVHVREHAADRPEDPAAHAFATVVESTLGHPEVG